MIGLIGIFVITSSACYTTPPITTTEYFKDIPIVMSHREKICVDNFIRVSTSSATTRGEIARPVCEWIGHQWMEINDFIKRGEIIIIDDRYETQRCLYCNKRRIKKEVWEDVK